MIQGVATLLFAAVVAAHPTSDPPTDAVVAAQDPLITASPVQYNPSRTFKHRRDIFSSLDSDLNSIFSDLGSDIPSYVASGVPNFFQDFPTGDGVKSSLGLSDAQVSALPTQVLNIDPYANWTTAGWSTLR